MATINPQIHNDTPKDGGAQTREEISLRDQNEASAKLTQINAQIIAIDQLINAARSPEEKEALIKQKGNLSDIANQLSQAISSSVGDLKQLIAQAGSVSAAAASAIGNAAAGGGGLGGAQSIAEASQVLSEDIDKNIKKYFNDDFTNQLHFESEEEKREFIRKNKEAQAEIERLKATGRPEDLARAGEIERGRLVDARNHGGSSVPSSTLDADIARLSGEISTERNAARARGYSTTYNDEGVRDATRQYQQFQSQTGITAAESDQNKRHLYDSLRGSQATSADAMRSTYGVSVITTAEADIPLVSSSRSTAVVESAPLISASLLRTTTKTSTSQAVAALDTAVAKLGSAGIISTAVSTSTQENKGQLQQTTLMRPIKPADAAMDKLKAAGMTTTPATTSALEDNNKPVEAIAPITNAVKIARMQADIQLSNNSPSNEKPVVIDPEILKQKIISAGLALPGENTSTGHGLSINNPNQERNIGI